MVGPLQPSAVAACILVVDDHEINRAVIARQLELLGLTCVALGSADEALDLLRDAHFDLLMTDLYMPGMSGLELATRVREISAIPVVLLTAREDMKHADTSPASPFDAVVLKPVSVDALRSSLLRLLPADTLASALPAGAKARSDRSDAFDLGRLDALAAHGVDPQAFVKQWCQSIEEDLAQLDAFIRRNDRDGVRAQLHRLSGALGLVGAHGLMDVLEKANLTSKTFTPGIVDGLTERVRALMEQISEWGDVP